jgi:hypothetical protein
MSARLARALVPLLLLAIALTGCSKSSTSAGDAPGSAASTTFVCPTDNTQSFAKTRFVTNIALAGGTFHRWIWKPYQAGTFASGADGRTLALIKAGLAGAFAAKQLKDATENVKADPALCKAFYQPLSDLTGKLSDLKDKISSGDTTAVQAVQDSVTSLENQSSANGMAITEDENASIGG